MQRSPEFARLVDELCAAEAAARTALDRGLQRDLACLGRFVERPSRTARDELEAELLSLGPVEPQLRKNLIALEADLIALRCARSVVANARVRFGAHFGMYASAVADAEQRFVSEATVARGSERRFVPARIVPPRIDLADDLAVVPKSEASLSEIEEWTEDLALQMKSALEAAVKRARDLLMNRAMRSIARTRVAARLAACRSAAT